MANLQELADSVERVSSAYVATHAINRDNDWFMFKLQEELGEATQKYLMLTGRARTKGLSSEEIRASFEDELADVLGHLLLLSKHMDVDLEKALERKWLSYLK